MVYNVDAAVNSADIPNIIRLKQAVWEAATICHHPLQVDH